MDSSQSTVTPPEAGGPHASSERHEQAARDVQPQGGGGVIHAFVALRHRNYRLYWSGHAISLLGTWMQATGMAWLVLQVTQSAWQLGVVSALTYLPVLYFALLGGVFADRWPKRRVLFVTQTIAMLQAFALFALRTTHALQVWEIYLLALALGVATSVEDPASSAFVAELVGRDDLPNAIALNSLLTNLVRILGPGLAGVIIVVGGVDPLFLLNALSFIVALIMLAVISPRQMYGQPSAGLARQSAWQSLREGIDYVRQSTAIMLIISVVGLALLWGANFTVIMPIFATDVLHVGAQGYGALVAAVGVGALGGGIWLAWNHRRPTIQAILLGVWLFGVLEIGFALSPVYLLSLLFLASIGCIETIFSAQSVTALQSIAPDRLRGRVMSVFFFSIAGSAPLGFLLAGWLTAQVGAPQRTTYLRCTHSGDGGVRLAMARHSRT